MLNHDFHKGTVTIHLYYNVETPEMLLLSSSSPIHAASCFDLLGASLVIAHKSPTNRCGQQFEMRYLGILARDILHGRVVIFTQIVA